MAQNRYTHTKRKGLEGNEEVLDYHNTKLNKANTKPNSCISSILLYICFRSSASAALK